ncbi:trypsin-like peptidase domain-containing protein [Nodularia spumigena CS-586/05]|uniref:trypsin-like peptidase domain-containing protein n=1 Tax=Nodularia spumigena TaxID=70799 RepID=UPI00232D9DB4|nr:trypsin-like peptidase domain-containing protein [Nodularia spumigena]MDB9342938.1 trypsin-like peptidase domain-containing protein [Nodularia spumigena CS-588/06]MDB9369041.1 trypsin-like peptidase domain-containing protein [Nodularia spumigena CS-586/05]
MNAIDFNSHKNSIIRIFYQDDVVGIGFLVAEKYALTCAHVVGEALLISSSIANRPDGEIQVDFPLANSTEKIKATVVHWYPTSDLNSDIIIEDIAVLKLEHLPSQAQPTKLILAENISKHPFKVFGCPQGVAFGVWATGVLSEQNAKQWVQLEDTKVTGYAIAKGFSGSPVWDEQLQGVVGMVVAADSRREAAKASFMIPNQTLVKSWQYLESVVMGSKPIEKPVKSALLPAKRRFLEQRKQQFEENIEAVSKQMSFESNLANYLNLERQITFYFEELEKIERELADF